MRKALATTTVLIALVAAGCAGSSHSKSSSGSGTGHLSTSSPAGAGDTVTREAYVANADKVCTAAHAQQDVLRRQSQGLTLDHVAPLLNQQATVASDLAAKLKALAHPPSDDAPVATFISSVQQIATDSTNLAKAITAGETTSETTLRAQLIQDRLTEHAIGEGYGYKVCATGTSY